MSKRVIRSRIPSMMNIFNLYSTKTIMTYECSGCGRRSNNLLFFDTFNFDGACYCVGCVQMLTRENKELLFKRFNKLPRTRKRCKFCNVQTHNIMKLGKFRKQYLCHNCWGIDIKRPIIRKK